VRPWWRTIRAWRRDGGLSDDEPTALTGLLQRAERYIYLGAGTILAAAAVALLVSAVIEMIEVAARDSTMRAIIHLLDRVLLALMLAEVIYTVTGIARRRRLDVEPFLIIGVIAAVRRMLVITAEASDSMDLADPHFQAVLTELALLGGIILALAVSLRVINGTDTRET